MQPPLQLQVSYNGKFISAGAPVIEANNRAFRYGDGLFESIRIIQREACFTEFHYDRLLGGMEALKIEVPSYFSAAWLDAQIKALIRTNGIADGGKARLTVFRESDGNYAPTHSKAGYLLTVESMDTGYFKMDDEGISVDIYSEIPKPVNKLANYKTGNALIYIMATLYARDNNLDDVLLVNHKGAILEASSSNVFVVSNGVLYTPTLEDGCVGGIMRMNIINLALANDIKVYECTLTSQNLLAADEVFLSNSILGIHSVKSYRSKRYYTKTARLLIDKLNEKIKTNLTMGLQESW